MVSIQSHTLGKDLKSFSLDSYAKSCAPGNRDQIGFGRHTSPNPMVKMKTRGSDGDSTHGHLVSPPTEHIGTLAYFLVPYIYAVIDCTTKAMFHQTRDDVHTHGKLKGQPGPNDDQSLSVMTLRGVTNSMITF